MNLLKSLRSKLQLSDNNTEMFSLNGKFKLCKVVDVYDGDTCKVVFKAKGKIYRWNVRMYGYDSPEMRVSLSKPDRELIKARAIEARDHLINLVQKPNQLVYIRCGEFDKYGRLLGTLYLSKDIEVSVNEMMINAGHGTAYYGGTKK
jgi:endonuclease YncB( thermonuclease family)